MNQIWRYIAKQIVVAIVPVLLALVLLFALFDLIRELQDLGRGNYGLSMIFLTVGLTLPTHTYIAFPPAVLIGTLVALSRLSALSELTVMRAAGLSLWRLGAYVALLGLAFAACAFALAEFVMPYSEQAARQIKLRAQSAVIAQEFRSGYWVKDDKSFINVRAIKPDLTLERLRIYEFETGQKLKRILSAASAVYREGNTWVLTDVEETRFDNEQVSIARRPRDEWQSSLRPELLSVMMVNPEQMTFANLSSYVQHLRENNQRSTREEIALWNKVLYPVSIVLLMLFAIGFAVHTHRSGGVTAKIVAGILLGLAFNLGSRLVNHVGLLNEWPPVLTALTPSVTLALLTALLIAWRSYA